jgi:hypothetical protein
LLTIFAHDDLINLVGAFMTTQMKRAEGPLVLAELQEFASFSPAAQRYIRRSLDVAFCRVDAIEVWSRDKGEARAIREQSHFYEALTALRSLVPDNAGPTSISDFMGQVITLTAFDLAQARITSFGAYRFLYERLLGANVRPWLPAAFCAAAALPHLHPLQRRALLHSISEAAATAPGWSPREPGFFPEWVDKVELMAR